TTPDRRACSKSSPFSKSSLNGFPSGVANLLTVILYRPGGAPVLSPLRSTYFPVESVIAPAETKPSGGLPSKVNATVAPDTGSPSSFTVPLIGTVSPVYFLIFGLDAVEPLQPTIKSRAAAEQSAH